MALAVLLLASRELASWSTNGWSVASDCSTEFRKHVLPRLLSPATVRVLSVPGALAVLVVVGVGVGVVALVKPGTASVATPRKARLRDARTNANKHHQYQQQQQHPAVR